MNRRKLPGYSPYPTDRDLAPVYYPENGDPLFRRQQPMAEQQEESALLPYLRAIGQYKGLLLIAACIGVLCGVLWTLPQPPVYKAVGSIEIQSINEEFLNLKAIDATPEGEYGSEAYFQTQIRILRSETLLRQVVDQLSLATWPEYQMGAGRLAKLKRALGFQVPDGPATPNAILARVQNNLNAQAAGLTRVIELSFDASDPAKAADFVNRLVAVYVSTAIEERWKSTLQTAERLNQQARELKIKLEASDEALQSYARSTGLIYEESQEKLKQIQAELSRAQGDLASKQAQAEVSSKTTNTDSLSDVSNDATLREYQVKLADLRRQDAELSATLEPANPRVERVRAQIAQLESTVRQSRTNIVGRIGNDHSAAEARVRNLQTEYDRQAAVVLDQTAKSIRYNTLKQEADSTRTLYESVLQRVKEANIAAAMRTSNVRVVDPATPPTDPYKPNMILNAGFGFLAGLIGAVGLVMIREQLTFTIRAPGDPGFLLNLPELGVIPAGRSGPGMSLVTLRSKSSMLAESFRSLLASLVFSSDRERAPKVLVVTSASKGEGKSTISTNLALALAEAHKNVVLIDGDLRKPSLHKLFDLAGKPMLADLVTGSDSFDEMDFRSSLRDVNVPNLFLLGAGDIGSNPSNFFYSPRLMALLTKFRQTFDVVIIDTPPMLHLPDARLLSRYADGVILVVRSGKTTRETAQSAAQTFAEDGTRVLGTVLNSWAESKAYGAAYKSYGMK